MNITDRDEGLRNRMLSEAFASNFVTWNTISANFHTNVIMFPVPSPSAGRGEVVLQPNYFTSSVYVKALRDDLSTLILKYHEAYSQSASDKPFAIFKKVWLDMGWHWLHFKVFDSRSRQTFLEVTLRLFFGKIAGTQVPTGLYT